MQNLLLVLSFVVFTALAQQPSVVWPAKWTTSRNQVTTGGSSRVLIDFATYAMDASVSAAKMTAESFSFNGTFYGAAEFLFTNKNCYFISPVMKSCCLLVPNLAPTSPDWIAKLNPTYNGLATYLGEPAYSWTFSDGTTNHGYYQRVSDPRFPFARLGLKPQDTVLEYFHSEIVDSFPAGTFDLPSSTCSTSCGAGLGAHIIPLI